MNGGISLYVAFLLVLRLVVPLAIVIGINYLLERTGVTTHAPLPPKNW